MNADEPQPVTVTVELSEAQAWALAELCKRIGWADARALSVDEAETHQMIRATDRLAGALREAGFSPR